jgi:hypothetical protein
MNVEQADAASADTRRILADAGIGDGTPGPDANLWADAFVGQIMDRGATACLHVKRRPAQPIFAYAWERIWRCRQCDVAHTGKAVEQRRAGTHPDLGPIEEHTCDRCRRYCRDPLTVLVVRCGFVVVYAGLCTSCANEAEQAGGRNVA